MSADPRLRGKAAPVPPPPPPPDESPDSSTAALDGSVASAAPSAPTDDPDGGFKLKFCTVCASNNNRYVSHSRPGGGWDDLSTSAGTVCFCQLPGKRASCIVYIRFHQFTSMPPLSPPHVLSPLLLLPVPPANRCLLPTSYLRTPN